MRTKGRDDVSTGLGSFTKGLSQVREESVHKFQFECWERGMQLESQGAKFREGNC